MEIDIHTLIIVLGFTHLLQVLVFFHQYKVNKAYRGLNWWLLWSWAETIGFGAILLRNNQSILPLVIIVQNVMIIAGTLFLYIGIKRFFNKTINTKLVISILSVYVIGLFYFLFIKNDIQIRSGFLSIILALVSFLTAYSLFSDKTKNVAAAANFNAMIFIVHGGIFVYRFIMIAYGTNVENFFTPTLFNIIPYLDALVVSLLCTFGLIIMLNQRLNAEMVETNLDLQLIFNTSTDAAMITRLKDGLIYDINEGFTHITGYTRKDMIGKSTPGENIWKNIEDRHKVVVLLKENGYYDNFETQFLIKDGTEITGLISAKIINLHDIPHIISITRDITERRRLEAEFKESELRFSSLFENMNDGVALHQMIYNEDGIPVNYRITNVNRAFEKHTNIPVQKARGSTATELYGVEKAPYLSEYHNVLVNKQTYNFETYFKEMNKDFIISAIYTQPGFFATIFRDISERKNKESQISELLESSENSRKDLLSILEDQIQAQDSLRDSEERYRNLLDAAPIGIAVHCEGKIVFANPMGMKLFGAESNNQIVGKPVNEIMSPVRFLKNMERINRLIQGEKDLYPVEDVYIRIDGKEVEVEVIASLITFNKKSAIQVIVTDITERIKAQESLRIYTERLRNLHIIDQAILQAIESPEAIVQTALQYIVKLLNCKRATVGIFDLEKKDVRIYASDADDSKVIEIGTKLPEMSYGEIETMRKGKMEIVEDLSTLTPTLSIIQMLQLEEIKSFINVPLLSSLQLYGVLNIAWENPRTISPEEIEVTTEVANQITIAIEQANLLRETKNYAEKLEKRVRDRTAQLVIANKELESFAYSVSHDLRAPLRHIDGFTKLLKGELKTESTKISHFINIITSSTLKMGAMIDSLLNFSRLGRHALQKSEIDLQEIISKIIIQFEPEIKNRTIEWKIGKLPVITADYNLLTLVFENLISNAIKFTAKKNIAIIEIGSCEQPTETCTIFVKDNGAGFDPEYGDKLFGVFQRLHSNEEFEGIGIGLANVKQIIKKHGGKIWAKGKVNEGATFFITI